LADKKKAEEDRLLAEKKKAEEEATVGAEKEKTGGKEEADSEEEKKEEGSSLSTCQKAGLAGGLTFAGTFLIVLTVGLLAMAKKKPAQQNTTAYADDI